MKLLGLLFLPLVLLAQDLPEGKGKDITERSCGACHEAGVVSKYRNSKDDWLSVVEDMKGRGADGSDDDFRVIVDYLAHFFGPNVNVNQAASKELETQLELTPAESEAIVQYRRDHGNYKSFDDLKKVPGIDVKKLEPLRQRIAC